MVQRVTGDHLCKKKTAVRRLSSFREKMKMKKMGKLQKILLFIEKKKKIAKLLSQT